MYYLTEIEIRVNYLNDFKDSDFGIFLVESFPIKKSYLDHNAFHLAKDKLNEVTKYNFGHAMGIGNSSTPFEKVEIKNIDILQNYFADNKKFNRMKDKHIENQIKFYHISGSFTFSNQITVIGTDPEEKYYSPPSGN